MYLHDLMRGMDSAPSMNQSEVRQAVSKIFQWVDDPKNICLIAVLFSNLQIFIAFLGKFTGISLYLFFYVIFKVLI